MATDITAMVKASQDLTVTGQPTNTNTVTIGGKAYTFQDTLTNSDGNVNIGTDAEDSIVNLRKAINLDGVSGTDYAAAMTVNPHVVASDTSATVMKVTAKVTGVIGNLILTIQTHANGVWGATELASGAGNINVFIDELQAGFQLNSALIAALAQAEA